MTLDQLSNLIKDPKLFGILIVRPFGLLLQWLYSIVQNYGLAVILFALLVKLVCIPLTIKSKKSMLAMSAMNAELQQLQKKYANNRVKLNEEMQKLYEKHGVSPMSGCLPMLLQMPILIALFMFFPSAIELRHQSFLWANDLSTYDAIVSWEANIPLISTYFGNHISLFCLLMTITNIVYTKFNMEMTNTGQQQMPGMQMMMYLMPLMFLVFFNQYASGLTYYYFISTLITILQTIFFRFTINEEKLLAKLEANKRKPQKRSTFMKRLEEMQKMQEETLRTQQAAREANKRR